VAWDFAHIRTSDTDGTGMSNYLQLLMSIRWVSEGLN
jgi:hypothetical protein